MKKMIAPLIITLVTIALLGLWAVLYIFVFTVSNLPGWISILTGIIFLGLILAMIVTFRARIKELRKEKEDDYSQY